MALQNVRMIVRAPKADAVLGESISAVLLRARRYAPSTVEESPLADPMDAVYRAFVDIARVSHRWMGDCIIPGIVGVTKYPLPANFYGLVGPAWWKGTPICPTTIADLQHQTTWGVDTGTPSKIAFLSNDSESQVWPKPTVAGPRYYFDDVANTLEDASTTVLHTGTAANYSTDNGGTYTIEGSEWTGADVIEAQVNGSNETMRLRYWTAPSKTSLTRATLISREIADILVEYLAWELLKGSRNKDDIAKSVACLTLWSAFIRAEAGRSSLDTVFPDGQIHLGWGR